MCIKCLKWKEKLSGLAFFFPTLHPFYKSLKQEADKGADLRRPTSSFRGDGYNILISIYPSLFALPLPPPPREKSWSAPLNYQKVATIGL